MQSLPHYTRDNLAAIVAGRSAVHASTLLSQLMDAAALPDVDTADLLELARFGATLVAAAVYATVCRGWHALTPLAMPLGDGRGVRLLTAWTALALVLLSGVNDVLRLVAYYVLPLGGILGQFAASALWHVTTLNVLARAALVIASAGVAMLFSRRGG